MRLPSPVSMSREVFLITAITARALASSAARGGFDTVALDLFDDVDLVARVRRKVCAKKALRFSSSDLLRAAIELAKDFPLVYGAGFEGNAPLLLKLSGGRELCGNAAETIAEVNDPKIFFSGLSELGISYPEVSFGVPSRKDAWLAKKIGGAGGWHIHSTLRPSSGYYFQRRVAGRSLSALFLADGENARIVGFNETWTQSMPRAPYCYAGAISHPDVPGSARDEMAKVVEGMVKRFRLVGLNGVDFMLNREQIQVLEINARPPATLELYDEDFAQGIFAAHVDACRGSLPSEVGPFKVIRASAIVYADRPLAIAGDICWPRYAADLPRSGSFIPRGNPICSVEAEGASFAQVKREALARKDHIIETLQRKAA
jgi:predicted ATP-grasp superfamily ATP-dependent carboligase